MTNLRREFTKLSFTFGATRLHTLSEYRDKSFDTVQSRDRLFVGNGFIQIRFFEPIHQYSNGGQGIVDMVNACGSKRLIA